MKNSLKQIKEKPKSNQDILRQNILISRRCFLQGEWIIAFVKCLNNNNNSNNNDSNKSNFLFFQKDINIITFLMYLIYVVCFRCGNYYNLV